MNTVVIGSSPEQKVPSMVLERSIIKHSVKPVRVIHTYDWPRLTAPEFAGIATYIECDQLVFRDVFDWAKVAKIKQTLLSIIDVLQYLPLLHYTNMEAQPWRKWGHPMQEMWLEALFDAFKYGAVARLLVESEVKAGHIVPEVYEWLHKRIYEPKNSRTEQPA